MKRFLGILLTAMLALTIVFPVSAAGDVASLERRNITKAGSADATLVDNLNLDIDGITFTSGDPDVINPTTGVVTRPDLTKSVTVTASDGNATKDFAFRVLGKDVPVGGEKAIPAITNVLYSNDFSGTAMDSARCSFSANNCSQDGAIYLTRETGSGTEAFGSIYPNGFRGAGIEGKFLISYALDKYSADNGAFPHFAGSDGIYLSLQSWSRGAGLKVIGKETKSYSYNDFAMAEGKLKITVAFDTAAGTFDLWINNQFVTSGESAGATNVQRISFGTGGDASISGSHKIDDLVIGYTEPCTTICKDSFEGASLPACVSDAQGATIDTENKAIKLGKGIMTLDLCEGYNLSGKITTNFIITRPDYYSGNCQVWIKDKSGALVTTFTWFSGANGMYVYYRPSIDAAESSVVVPMTIYDGEANVSVIVDTATQRMDIWVNSAKVVSGYTQAAVEGVAKFMPYDNAQAGPILIKEINCFGNASYSKEATYYQDDFSGAQMSSHITTPASYALVDGKLKMTGTGTINLSEDGKSIPSKTTVEIKVHRDVYAAKYTDYFVQDEDGNKIVQFRWGGSENIYNNVYVFYAAEKGGAETNKAYASNPDRVYEADLTFIVTYNPTTQKVSISTNGYYATGNSPDKIEGYALSNAGGIAKLMTMYPNGMDASYFYYLSSVNCYGTAEISLMPIAPDPIEVTEFAIDYNAYDKKLCIASPDDGSFTVIVAAYSGDTLISAAPASVTLNAKGEVIADTSALKANGADRVKILVWNDLSGLNPIKAPLVINDVISAN